MLHIGHHRLRLLLVLVAGSNLVVSACTLQYILAVMRKYQRV